MHLTTIEYLNLPAKYNSYSSSEEEDYSDSDYYFDEHNRKRTKKSKYHWIAYRMVTHKIRRIWIIIMRKFSPQYRYQRIGHTKQTCPCGKRQKRSVLPQHSDSMDMEEFLATKTIRPTIDLDKDINYNDDMGLDVSLLDEDEDIDNDVLLLEMNKNKKRISSKAAKLLDISEQQLQEINTTNISHE